MSEHLKQVIVLTELQRAGGSIHIASLCQRVSGQRAEVERLVEELVKAGVAERDGEWVVYAGLP